MKTLKLIMTALSMSTLAATASADALVSVPDRTALHWQQVPRTEGAISYANVEGDLFGEGPYSAYVKFRKGVDNGLHSHSQTLPTLVLSGTFYAVIEGKRVEYPAGSYYKLPGNLVHESGCTAAADCLLFQHQAGRFDLRRQEG